jgi:hypothetical protein
MSASRTFAVTINFASGPAVGPFNVTASTKKIAKSVALREAAQMGYTGKVRRFDIR